MIVFDELYVSWHTEAGTFRLSVDPTGRPTLSGPANPPAASLPAPPRPSAASRRPDGPAARGRKWTEAEDAELAARFDQGEDPVALAERFERTAGAIRARLVRLGLLDAEAAGLRYPVVRAAGEGAR